MTDVFISYARTDSRDFVARLSTALEERGKDAWVDLQDIPAASVWSEDLRAGIAGSDSFCFVISPRSVASQHCRTELDYAVGLGKRIEHGEKPVETDGRAIKRGKIDVTHDVFSCRATRFAFDPERNPRRAFREGRGPDIGCRRKHLGSPFRHFKFRRRTKIASAQRFMNGA